MKHSGYSGIWKVCMCAKTFGKLLGVIYLSYESASSASIIFISYV